MKAKIEAMLRNEQKRRGQYTDPALDLEFQATIAVLQKVLALFDEPQPPLITREEAWHLWLSYLRGGPGTVHSVLDAIYGKTAGIYAGSREQNGAGNGRN